MSQMKKRRLILFNAVIVLVEIALFSNAFLGLSLFSGSALSLLIAWAALLVSVAVFMTGNSLILSKKETRFLMQNIQSLDHCVSVFKEAIHNGDVFDKNILQNIEQIKRFKRKYDTIKDMLLQKFSSDEMSFHKFKGVLAEVESVIYLNMRSILNKISAFDMAEYEAIHRAGAKREDVPQEKLEIYNDYIDFVNTATQTNEDILLKMDKMLLEISRYNSMEDGDIQKLPAIIEMDELIRNAKLYK